MDFCYRRNRKIEDTKKADKAFDKVYAEKGDDSAALQELLGYVRAGDTVTIEDAIELGESATEFIELALALYRKRAVLICKTPKIDTAAGYWQMVLAEITKLTAGNNGNDDGRPSRFVEDLSCIYFRVPQCIFDYPIHQNISIINSKSSPSGFLAYIDALCPRN